MTLYLFCSVLLYDPCVRMDWISETVITTNQFEKEVDVGACAMYAKKLSSPPSEKESWWCLCNVCVRECVCMHQWQIYATRTFLFLMILMIIRCNNMFISICITWKIYKARIMWMCVEACCLLPDSIEHCICDGFNCFVLQCFIKM